MNDILFEQTDWIFSYRVGGLLYRDGKILLQHQKGDNSYAIPGGHVERGEFSQETLSREFMEETGAAVKVGRLCFVQEQLWQWHKPCHQINLFYLVELKDPYALPKTPFHVLDELGQERIGLEFCWKDLQELDRLSIFPTCLKPYLKELPEHVVHLQENQMEG